MRERFSDQSSRKLAVLFLGVVVPPAVTLVWLGLRLLEQDRVLLAQRELEARQNVAESVIHSLEESLLAIERVPPSGLSDGMVRLTISDAGLKVEPTGRLLWFPVSAGLKEAERDPFSAAEMLEFRDGAQQAMLTYERLRASKPPSLRVGALLRIARVHRRAGRIDKAFAAYRELAGIEGIAVDGMPADLVARRAVCSLLAQSGQREELRRATTLLIEDFLAGKWALDKPAWQLVCRQLEGWNGQPIPFPAEAEAFSHAAEWLWDQWKRSSEGRLQDFHWTTHEGLTLIRQDTALGTSVTAVSRAEIERWLSSAVDGGRLDGQRLSLITPGGRLLAGSEPASADSVVRRLAAETGLPWTVILSPGNSALQEEEMSYRRRLLLAGLVAIMVLLAGSSYLLWRVIRRELAVARLQAEFVAAVSHEFRTPLTSLRHVTELMQEDDNLPPERRRSFYESLARNTERLYRLVESLLDFARMEGKRKPYELQSLNLKEFVAQTVADFRREFEPYGFSVEMESEDSDHLRVRADADALSNALWNLLDNAVKYSTNRRTIRVVVARRDEQASIAVEDQGIGISAHEQKEIFRRFVRGEQASRLGIKGTGLGLAMVEHIVRAHGGRIEVESHEGEGSTFRIVLPREG